MGIAALSAVSKQKARKKELQAQIDANNQTARGLLQSMNYTFQNYETQRRAAFAAQIDAMTKDRMNAHRQEASVKASVNEELAGGGRTANLINRSIRADESRVASQSQANYQTKMNEIDLNKEAALISTRNAINSIPSVETPSYFTQAMEMFSDYLNTYNALQGISSMRKKAGVEGGHGKTLDRNTGDITPVNLDPYIHSEDIHNTGIGTRIVDLDEASAKYDSMNLFNPHGLFASNAINGYFSGDMSSGLSYDWSTGGISRSGATWRNGLLVL
jgi:hypothetical protein